MALKAADAEPIDASDALDFGKRAGFAGKEPDRKTQHETFARHRWLYQSNTRVWLTELSRSHGRPATPAAA